jgi:hypothetical protein
MILRTLASKGVRIWPLPATCSIEHRRLEREWPKQPNAVHQVMYLASKRERDLTAARKWQAEYPWRMMTASARQWRMAIMSPYLLGVLEAALYILGRKAA